ncbi:hypothetical protein M409DRAFT_27201 [Zasmidium cellare ATCC 36951]|uniref:Uncharacterized protein n=1 Tax=Zasmidium cellare ATCC 36951 TaxID=1080233 RepID=A0A6A6CAB2_ZASCE|nr:uncharacterized protein M409DRAFT_27201 [Zasmidium cellare ATCC 36951]KAF2162579.1 hypothetical protein M409DRAFT_27201 [Zasmidium cellare ATCC 36951]
MAIWPFKRRRRPSQPGDTASRALLSEKAKPATASPPVAPAPPVQRRGSRRTQRRASQQGQAIPATSTVETGKKQNDPTDKENIPNVPLRSHESREDITALPITQRLEQSPHLRPVDLERPSIPYNFRPHSMSQTSVQRQEATVKPQRPHTLHSKRSTTDYSTPPRRTSSKQSRRRDDHIREEEIRAMSKPIPIPKRPGDGPLRRDSKKMRGATRDSEVSLPPEGSIHSAMSGVMEQRGWEIGSFAVLSPRPHVRLSGTPQYVSSSLPPSTSGILYRIDSTRAKEKDKAPATRDSARKRRTVGQEADELDASDIRTIMERDAKRREKKQQGRMEKLERKLRSREGRNRGDSDLRREEMKREGGTVAEQIQARGAISPPTAVHPALRNIPAEEEEEAVGLGIGKAPPPVEPMDVERQRAPEAATNTVTPQNPFTDAAQIPAATPRTERPANASGTSLPMETPMEEPEVRTAQAVQYSFANTPPLSPIYAGRATSSASQLDAPAQRSIAEASTPLPRPPPIVPVERRSSDPPTERRAGAWASLFKRGGTNRRKDGAASPSEFSFSNTSRESMRNQPLPAHLVDTQAHRPPNARSKSGTPVRTQSKFREDLPEMPISPPDSRNQSPDVTTSAAAMAAARRAGRATPQPVDIPGRMRESDRNDTPVSQTRSPGGAIAASLASIDSEGEWLAGGPTKRQSQQSGLSRSLSKRQQEFSASYEELGGDKDAEYFSQNRSRKVGSPALMAASPDEESEEDMPIDAAAEGSTAPLKVHESVRRRPTLVERNPRLKSREGLVGEYASAEVVDTPDGSTDEEPDSPAPQLERATSVQYGSRHSRQFSAGSAKLLDVHNKRTSTPTPEPGAFPQDPS